jgi:molecular chaperone HtpG
MAHAEKETLGFQAEVKQLLQLMIHSLYSNKEIFLRELISNASDAADKLRFEAINNDALYGNDHELKIKVSFDKDEKKETILKDEFETVNQASALWARNRSEITKEQYDEFYKHVSHDFQEPLAYTHNRVEGRSEYTQLLYVPSHAPFDLWDRNKRGGIKLYVKRVFIMDDAEQLMPTYLRFIKGVIDSADLPLNVSREILQESRDVKVIREGSTKRVLGMLEELANADEQETKDKYVTFWKEFGQVLKEGIGEDATNKDRIAKLLRFASTQNELDEQTVSFADYVARMKEGQDKIYYVTADNFNAAKNSPHLEIFRKKGVEVLLLTDRVDEWMLSFLTEFEGKELTSVAKGGLDLGKLEDEAEKKEHEETETQYKELVEQMKGALAEKAKDVRVTHRLTDSPACLVADEHELSANLVRMLKAAGQNAPESKPILEINPNHPLVTRLKYEDASSPRFADWSHILFDQAMLAEGGSLSDPASFVKRLNEMLLATAK